jgi:hypothetical protein
MRRPEDVDIYTSPRVCVAALGNGIASFPLSPFESGSTQLLWAYRERHEIVLLRFWTVWNLHPQLMLWTSAPGLVPRSRRLRRP